MLRRTTAWQIALAIPVVWTCWPSTAVAAAVRWHWPLAGQPQVVQTFAPPATPWGAGQRGVLLAGRAGEPVLAAGAGQVSFAGQVGGVPVIAVRHPDGLETTYEPVRPVVTVGGHVLAGTVIGRLVSAGSECAPAACLHWGLKRGADYLDPLGLVGAARVRLLPLGEPDRRPLPPAAAPAMAALGPLIGGGWLLARRRTAQRPAGRRLP